MSTDPSDWHFVQEDRVNSVVAGIAATGGLWTSADGLFSFFFGGTLALLLWGGYSLLPFVRSGLEYFSCLSGKKPLAIFGFFDQFCEDTHRQAWDVAERELKLERESDPQRELTMEELQLTMEKLQSNIEELEFWLLDRKDRIMLNMLRDKLVDLGQFNR
jgi:hypothetical protein